MLNYDDPAGKGSFIKIHPEPLLEMSRWIKLKKLLKFLLLTVMH